MEVKLVLAFAFCACFCLADGCNKSSSSGCTGNNTCNNHTTKDKRSLDNRDKRQTRNIEKNGKHYSIALQNPCSFNTYDKDLDGTIAIKELHASLGISEVTDALFVDLDIMTDDGVEPDEFNAMAPLIINECLDTYKN